MVMQYASLDKVINGSDIGVAPVWWQTITWNTADFISSELLVGDLV